MSESDLPRTVLPIPERPHVGLVTYDAKDPDTSFLAPQPQSGRGNASTNWASI